MLSMDVLLRSRHCSHTDVDEEEVTTMSTINEDEEGARLRHPKRRRRRRLHRHHRPHPATRRPMGVPRAAARGV